jgi:hypothetical protein
MVQHIFVSNRDKLLVAFPFVFVLLLSVFRLDHLIAARKPLLIRRRPACGVDKSGEPILRDPDGRLSGSRRRIMERR